ncbi:MAG TPA: PKD domain-containing protein [Bacteroidia bacterium]|nr:PKD domain-containing protein [Bacteroidia bacterium]
MKNITHSVFIIALLGSFFPKNASAQCTAFFTWTQTANNTITFTDASTGNCGVPMRQWAFGDMSSGFGGNPVHFYSAPGNYIVTLIVTDSISSSWQTQFTDTITVTGTVFCNLSSWIGISQHPTCSTCADGALYAGSNNGTAPFTYLWSTGAVTPMISNLNPGFYSVCVTDANNCQVCDTLTLDTVPYYSSCIPSFTHTQSQPNVVDFSGSTILTQPMWGWSFGDNSGGYGPNTSHTYAYTGVYNVCLSVWDSLSGCSGTYCDTVSVWGNNASCQGSFYSYYDSLVPNTAWVVNQSVGAQPISCTWYWGDNTFDTIQYPSHTYTVSGTYSICLVIHDNAGCTDSVCQNIAVYRMAYSSASVPFYVNVVGPTGIRESSQQSWSLFPNPAENEIRIKTDYSLNGKQYRIVDISGRILVSSRLDGNRIDISSFDKGIYFLQIENGDNGAFSSQRFIKN